MEGKEDTFNNNFTKSLRCHSMYFGQISSPPNSHIHPLHPNLHTHLSFLDFFLHLVSIGVFPLLSGLRLALE